MHGAPVEAHFRADGGQKMPDLSFEDVERLSDQLYLKIRARIQVWVVVLIFAIVGAIGTGGFLILEDRAIKIAQETVTQVNNQGIANKLAEEPGFRQDVADALFASLSNSVIAFDRAEGCPEGWRDWSKGAGRVIVGVGNGANLTPRTLGDSGGEESHELTVDELPKHSHGIYIKLEADNASGGNNYHRFVGTGNNSQALRDHTNATDNVGEGAGHNNMPPFVALHFCKKIAIAPDD